MTLPSSTPNPSTQLRSKSRTLTTKNVQESFFLGLFILLVGVQFLQYKLQMELNSKIEKVFGREQSGQNRANTTGPTNEVGGPDNNQTQKIIDAASAAASAASAAASAATAAANAAAKVADTTVKKVDKLPNKISTSTTPSTPKDQAVTSSGKK